MFVFVLKIGNHERLPNLVETEGFFRFITTEDNTYVIMYFSRTGFHTDLKGKNKIIIL